MMDTNEKKFSFVKKIIFGKKHDESRILNVKSTFYHMLKTTIAINTGQSHTVFTVLSNDKNLCSSFATPRSECSFAG